MTIETSATVVVVAALITALATGLGAVPFLFVARLAHSAIGVANALAAGFMLAASGLLFYEGAGADASLTVAGASSGSCSWPSPRGCSRRGPTFTLRRSPAPMPVRRYCSSA